VPLVGDSEDLRSAAVCGGVVGLVASHGSDASQGSDVCPRIPCPSHRRLPGHRPSWNVDDSDAGGRCGTDSADVCLTRGRPGMRSQTSHRMPDP
jgi:hypothetical protein